MLCLSMKNKAMFLNKRKQCSFIVLSGHQSLFQISSLIASAKVRTKSFVRWYFLPSIIFAKSEEESDVGALLAWSDSSRWATARSAAL